MSDHKFEERYYRLIMVISSLEPLKLKILQVLAHLSPQRVSASELTMLLGYSKKARTIYRGVLDELEADEFIIIDKITPKHFSIQISPHHPLMGLMIELAFNIGEEFTQRLHQLLLERNYRE
ncbi:MAG: hypothetical protein GPJ54_17485 [Candidatus Heimdallarchaeota archaeon]|nr:hypothetical protein [Candidatus Heimdallarchaeota archaeon]